MNRLTNSIILLIIFLFSTVSAHKQSVHQHITKEAFNLLELSFPNLLSEMGNYIGVDEVWSNSSADGSFGALKIVSGAYLEDEYDVVYHYGITEKPTFSQWTDEAYTNLFPVERDAFTSITHFWNADNGINSSVTLADEACEEILGTPVCNEWSFTINKNSMTKMYKYADGSYNFLWAYNNGKVHWDWCYPSSVQVYTKYNTPGIVDFYNAAVSFQAYLFYAEDGYWFDVSCPDWDTNNSLFYKGHAYEILGRMCHLLQDQSVPAHVHNDSHACQNDMNCEYYENNVENYHLWTAEEIFTSGQTFINPYNSWGDPLYYLMYLLNQVTDHYASSRVNGDDNYDNTCPGLYDIISV